jgi:hypothetical protein
VIPGSKEKVSDILIIRGNSRSGEAQKDRCGDMQVYLLSVTILIYKASFRRSQRGLLSVSNLSDLLPRLPNEAEKSVQRSWIKSACRLRLKGARIQIPRSGKVKKVVPCPYQRGDSTIFSSDQLAMVWRSHGLSGQSDSPKVAEVSDCLKVVSAENQSECLVRGDTDEAGEFSRGLPSKKIPGRF